MASKFRAQTPRIKTWIWLRIVNKNGWNLGEMGRGHAGPKNHLLIIIFPRNVMNDVYFGWYTTSSNDPVFTFNCVGYRCGHKKKVGMIWTTQTYGWVSGQIVDTHANLPLFTLEMELRSGKYDIVNQLANHIFITIALRCFAKSPEDTDRISSMKVIFHLQGPCLKMFSMEHQQGQQGQQGKIKLLQGARFRLSCKTARLGGKPP